MIKFAYHKTIRGKPVKREDGTLWQDGYKVNLGYGWQTAELEFSEIFLLLSVGGYAIAPALKSDHRNEENFLSSELALIDIDEGMTLEDLATFEFYQLYGAGYYTTPSHTENNHRFRLIYRLPGEVNDPNTMRMIYRGLLTIHGVADTSCKDSARLFYGTINADKKSITNRVIDEEGLALIVAAYDYDNDIKPVKTFAYKEHEYEPKSIEELGQILDELKRHYPDLRNGPRSEVTWAIAGSCSAQDTIKLMRERWPDREKTEKYESFIASYKRKAISLGTIYYMIRQHNPEFKLNNNTPWEQKKYKHLSREIANKYKELKYE